MTSSPLVLAVHRRDVERQRLLRLVRMSRSGIDLEMAHDAASERPARHHALHRLENNALRMLAVEDGAFAAALDAAGKSGMPIEDAVGTLVAGELDLLGIDHDDMVAAIHMRREGRLVLAA